jgi:hypothetical protein
MKGSPYKNYKLKYKLFDETQFTEVFFKLNHEKQACVYNRIMTIESVDKVCTRIHFKLSVISTRVIARKSNSEKF